MPPPPADAARPRSDRQTRKSSETRDRIFRAAIDLFSERGLNSVTVEQITDRADVGKGTFFNYFAGKEAVLAHFGVSQVERLQEALELGQLPEAPRERILDMLCLLARYERWTPSLARGLFVSALSHTRFAEQEGPQIWEIERMLAAVVSQGQAAGDFRTDVEAQHAAQYLLGQHFLALLVWCAATPEEDLVEITGRFALLALDSLAARCRTSAE